MIFPFFKHHEPTILVGFVQRLYSGNTAALSDDSAKVVPVFNPRGHFLRRQSCRLICAHVPGSSNNPQ